MEYVIFLVFLLFILCSNVSFSQVGDEECFIAIFNQGTEGCSDFENEIFICNLNVDIDSESNELILSGKMELKEDLEEDAQVVLSIFKELPSGKQFLDSFKGNLCESLTKEDAPWKPMIDALDTTECPITKGVYEVENLKMSLDFVKDDLRSEFCGEYVAEVAVAKGTEGIEKIACHEIGLEIKEVSCE